MLKKILLIIALCMIPQQIHAQSVNQTGTVSIEQTDTTDTFALYPILWIDTETMTYSLSEDFQAFLKSEKNTSEVKNITEYRLLEESDAQELLSLYACYIRENETVSLYSTKDEVEVKVGQYLILASASSYVYQPMLASFITEEDGEVVIKDNVTVSLKRSKPSITKEAEQTSYTIGEDVTYTIEAAIPTYAEASLQTTYQIKDQLKSGLSGYKDISIMVNDVELNSDAYDITQTETELYIDFEYDRIKQYSTIQVQYTSTLMESASVTSGNKNEVTLLYSGDPYGKSDTLVSTTDETTIYTYEIFLNKIDAGSEEGLSNVEFQLFTDEQCTKQIHFAYNSDKQKYIVSENEGILKTDAKGQMSLYGLKEGTYYLKETKTHSSVYQLPSTPFKIEIKDEANGFTNGLVESDSEETESGVVSKTVTNTLKTTQLPNTGGEGEMMLLVIGLCGMTGCAIFFKIRTHEK